MPTLHPLPTDPRPAVEYLVQVATGQVTDLHEVPHAGWEIVGFGISLFDKHPELRASLETNPEVKEAFARYKEIIESHRSHVATSGYQAVDWNTLIIQLMPVVIKLIELFTKK